MVSLRPRRESNNSPPRYFRLENEQSPDLSDEDTSQSHQSDEERSQTLSPKVYSPPGSSRWSASALASHEVAFDYADYANTTQQAPVSEPLRDGDTEMDFEIETAPDTPTGCVDVPDSPATEYTFAEYDDSCNGSTTDYSTRMPPSWTPAITAHGMQHTFHGAGHLPQSNDNLYVYSPPTPRSRRHTTSMGPGSEGYVMVGDIPYALSEIRSMAEALARSQDHNEFPRYKASFLNDANIVVNDFRLLNELRRARGNPADPNVPEEYRRLRIRVESEVARRNAEEDGEADRAEAARRVQAYMRVNNQEVQCFQGVSGAVQRRRTLSSQAEFGDIADGMVDAMEHGVANSAAPLRLSASRMDQQIGRAAGEFDAPNDAMGDQISSMNRQSRVVGQQLHQFDGNNQALNSHLRAMDHKVYEFNAKTTQALNDQFDPAEGHFSALNGVIKAQMSALSSLIDIQAATQSVIQNNLVRSYKMIDALADVAAVTLNSADNLVFQSKIDGAIERVVLAQVSAYMQANGPSSTTTTPSLNPANASFQAQRQSTDSGGLGLHPKNKNKGIKRVLGKFLGRKEGDGSQMNLD